MTERRLISNIENDVCKIRKNRFGSMVAQCMNSQSTLYVPIYISASLKQLVNVNLQTKTVQASFLIYISVFIDIQEQIFSMLQSKQICHISELKRFIQNNLKLQIGNRIVDIYYPQPSQPTIQEQQQQKILKALIKKRPSLQPKSSFLEHQHLLISIQQYIQQDQQYQLIQSQEDDQQQVYDEQYYTKKIFSTNNKITNHFISGIFNCEFQLNSFFFPYHQIKSNLKISVHYQHFKDIIVRYNLIFPQNTQDSCQQFNFIFPSPSYAKFGIYTINFNQHKVSSQVREDIHFTLDNFPVQQKTCMNLQFKIFSYNIPFVLRNQVPVWTLCIASLMLFNANADQISSIYGNTILLSVSFIFLLTNFRRGKYYSSTFSLYEFSVSCFIVANFLFLIDSTNHFYSHNKAAANVPSEMKLFHIYTGLALLGAFLSIIILGLVGIYSFQWKFNLPSKSGHILNNHLIGQFLAQSQSQDNQNQNLQAVETFKIG